MKSILHTFIILFSLINISSAQVIYVHSANEWALSNAISNASNGDTIMFDLPSYPATISIGSGFMIGNKKISIIGPLNQSVTLVSTVSQIFFLYNNADIEIKNLTLTRQSGTDNNFGQSLIYNSAILRINNCLLRNVVDSTAQGAVILNAWSGNLFLRNSTFSENYGSQGGAIYSTGNLDIESCTFNENYADNVGGGVFWHGNGGFFNCRNSIFQNSTCFKYDRVINSLGYNVSNDGSYGFNACSDFNNVSSIFLNPLQDNGGSTKTHSLNNCSIALNNGDPSITENDQRGLPVYGGVRDIGGYEAQSNLHSMPQSIDTRTECSPFIWIDGNTYTSNNNCSKYFLVGQGANGCDSLVTLNLIINSASTSTAPTAVAQTFCTSATVTNLVATGTAIKWYATAIGGVALASSNALVTGTTYYASQTVGTCESTRTAVAVTITPRTTPTFTQVAPICSGATLAALPTTSTNGITGTWSPALNNTATTTYTFTPTAGLCANTTTMTITVNPVVTPTFTQMAASCSNTPITPLPTTSTNGITGTWSPAMNNSKTTLYNFTPTVGQCASTATQTITITTPKVTSAISFVAPVATIGALNIGSASITGTMTNGIAASGVNASIPYTGGNGISYAAQTISSTGVSGLTATLLSGVLANGAGSLLYTISGTPTASGTASFAITIGGQTGTFTFPISGNLVAQYPIGSVFCNGPTTIVDVTSATGKIWMDRNLGATQVATSVTDTAAYGDLYQWGRGNDGHQCRNSLTTNVLSSIDQPGSGNHISAPNSPFDWRSPQNTNLWQGVNGVNNPCPSGYRLPTETEFNEERLSWNSNTSAGAFASPLKLTVAGGRHYNSNLSLVNVNVLGDYYSSTISGTNSRNLVFNSNTAYMNSDYRADGDSVRCIKDASAIPTIIGALNIGSATITGALTNGIAASGVSASIPYTGGSGGTYTSQTINSTGISGLTATLTSGVLANGSGSLSYTISGTPTSTGTASFAITIGGQSGSFTIPVAVNLVAQYPTGSVFCASGPTAIIDVTNPITGKTWMDRNLGASQVATSSTDALAYGDLYQWGRGSDGHQCRSSATTSTLSSTDQPGHGKFIVVSAMPYDWMNPQNNNLWQGINGINNPCPYGYRVPTLTEIDDERLSWVEQSSIGAFNSALILPVGGARYNDNVFREVGSSGSYWTSNLLTTNTMTTGGPISFGVNWIYMGGAQRDLGYSIRCIKN
jgi:predicted outer membrane repeat protein